MVQVLHNSSIIQKAHREYEKFNNTKQMRDLYELRERQRRDQLSLLDSAREEGIEQEKVDAAKKMLHKNYSIEDIAEITGFTKEQIVALGK